MLLDLGSVVPYFLVSVISIIAVSICIAYYFINKLRYSSLLQDLAIICRAVNNFIDFNVVRLIHVPTVTWFPSTVNRFKSDMLMQNYLIHCWLMFSMSCNIFFTLCAADSLNFVTST